MKINLKKLTLGFVIIALGIFGIFSFNFNNTTVVSAENESSYFSVKLYSTYNGLNSEENVARTNLTNGSVAYVRAGEVVEAKLASEDDSSIIKLVTPYITLNGTTYTNDELASLGISITLTTRDFALTSFVTNKDNPLEPYNAYGKYELNINYIVEENGIDNNKSLSFTYYMLPETNYYNGTNVQTTIKNAYNVSAPIYDRGYIYQYQYNDIEQGKNTNNLPSLTFNKKNFILNITKTFQKTETKQRIWFNGTDLETDNNLVYISQNNENNLVTIYFNDLGLYSIKYEFTYVYGDNIDILPPSTLNTVKRNDCIEIFGYQAYYSDVTTSQIKEFKNINNGIINESTDITYLTDNTFNTSLDATDESVDESTVLTNILNNLKNDTIKIQKTNQAPVQFKYNVELFNEDNSTNVNTQSGYWKLDSNFNTGDKIPYDNRPFTEAGTYLVKLVYKNYSLIPGTNADENCKASSIGEGATEKLRCQWFVFTITKETTQMLIKSGSKDILDGVYTNKDVTISKSTTESIFDAKTRLDVYKQANYTGNYELVATINDDEQFTATDNGNYIATMYFGKNLTRSYSSTFKIDKSGIENVQIFTVSQIDTNYYYKNSQSEVNFLTNQPVAVSWNNKDSGSKITASYKYIPLVKDNSTDFTSTILKQYYSYGTVPVEYYFDYNGQTLNEINYSNTQNDTYLSSTSILTESGMYIFHIQDSAGNEKYVSFIIDNTPNKILQEVDGEYVDATDINIISSDVTIAWGQYKVIRFNNINYANGQFDVEDLWLKNIINSTDIFNNYFDVMSINTVNTYFLKTAINSKVLLSVNGVSNFIPESEIVNNSYTIKFTQENNGNTEAKEFDYIFYTMDGANTKTIVGLDKLSKENYLQNYSGIHSVKISSDSSRTMLLYNKNNKQVSLDQDRFVPSTHPYQDNADYNQKDKYFIPTTINTLKDSNEILTLNFNPTPEEGVLEVLSVTYTYAPFSAKSYTNGLKTSYTYAFEEASDPITIYSKRNLAENICVQNEDGTYSWEVNKEYVYNNLQASYQTKAGKYTITRIYDNLTNTAERINSTYDFMVRTFTFIVDRNGIITSPDVVDEAGTTFNYVGESIKLQVLEEDNKMFFKDVFVAYNDPNGDNVVLTTNKLPVFVYVPVVKYGYSLGDGEPFNEEDSVNYWDLTNKTDSKISSYSLSAEIKYSYEKSNLNQSTIIYRSNDVSTDGYLKFNDSQSGRAFTQVGYYKVTIKQGYEHYTQNVFSFIFEITEDEPAFTVNNTSNDEELLKVNNVYYTNNEIIRLTWTDSDNQFMSIIDKSAITYSVNGNEPIVIDKTAIQSVSRRNYIDLNLKDIGAYAHNTNITITMQFEGKESDYNAGKFKTSRTVIVDTIAPTNNINKLVSLSGIHPDLIRNVSLKYNTSVSTGLYRYFAFAVDVKNIQSILDLTSYTNGEAYTILYRYFETNVDGNTVYTKYNDIYSQETSPNILENSSNNFETLDAPTLSAIIQNISTHLKPYIEIVEKDMAGNITVYTIYISNFDALSQTNVTPINYISNQTLKNVYYSDLANNMNIFAKSSLEITNVNMMDYAWGKITVGGTTYLKTPYLKDKYYNLSTYEAANPSLSETELSTFLKLTPSTQKQNIQIGLVPYFNTINLSCSVLNTSLSVIHTSSTNNYANEEGILIKIPSSASANDATIYAVSVQIVQYIKNQDGSYNQVQIYEKVSDTYFSTINQTLDNTGFVTLSYVNYMGSTYIKIIVTSPVKNRFYKYNVIDNFQDAYPITSIFGSEKIDKELYSSVEIVENYENGTNYYYSTKNMYYKYNSEKDRIILTVTNGYTIEKFDLYPDSPDIIRLKTAGYGQVKQSVGDSVYTLELYAPAQDMAEGIVGGEINFKLEIYEAITNINNGLPYKTLNLVIYNILPSITLLDSSNNSQNGLFNKNTMYGSDIKINFRQNVGRIPCVVFLEYEDGTLEQITSGKIVTEPATYSIVIKYTSIFTDSQYDTYLDFTISNNDEDFYKIAYKDGDEVKYANPTQNSFTYTENSITYLVTTHYILNTSDFELICNTEQDIDKPEPTVISSEYTTYIYKLTNVGSPSATKFFTRTIAITVIPKSSNILTKYSYYTNEGTRTDFDLTKTQESFVVSTEENNAQYKRIAWQSYYGIPENLVTVKIYFGDNQTEYKPNLSYEDNLTILTLTTSGTYYLTFSDLAGNVHMFNTLISTYTIKYLRNVIFMVNDASPINNAVYDDTVVVSIPSSTLRYYDTNAQPKISVLKNGEKYEPTVDRHNRTYTFTEAGLYKVWFSAAITENGVVKNINEEPLYFLIIRPKESRWSFEFSEYSDYYVESVVKDNIDITEKITNENMGKLTYKNFTNEDGTISEKVFLKNFLISINDALTGNGVYSVTINTDNEFEQKFTFSFWINNKVAPIQVSVKQNEATTKPITVSFNTADLIEDVGDCVLKINGYKDLVLNSKRLADGELQSSYNISITDADTYFIQLYSESGKLLYSYRVIKNEPLNAVSIILIVVGCIVAVGLTVMFILLRKKMKIR